MALAIELAVAGILAAGFITLALTAKDSSLTRAEIALVSRVEARKLDREYRELLERESA